MPSGFLFGATGRASPYPVEVIGYVTRPDSSARTASARARESVRFAAGVPMSSVKPATRTGPVTSAAT
nr:hypothetical protein [Actinoallomurus iriomotensis]